MSAGGGGCGFVRYPPQRVETAPNHALYRTRRGSFHRNLATVRALLEATLARSARQLEMVVLSAALARVCGLELTDPDNDRPSVERHGTTATLEALAEALIDPPAEVARRLNIDPGRVVEESREMALAMARLVDAHADLGGMFAGHTNLDADALADVVVVDLSAWRTHRVALPLVMICTAAWLQLATALPGRGRFQIIDEAWALLNDEATARWMQTNQKLARQLSLSVVNVMHRLSDTAAAGDAGTTLRSLAEGVIADAGTWIIYRQKPAERPLLADTLQLNDVQAALATALPRGRGLWIVGGETCGLRVRDVAFLEREIRPTVQYPAEPLKTPMRRTPIPVADGLLEAIAEQIRPWPGEHVLTGRDGGQLGPWHIDREMRRARVKVDGLPEGFRYHDLRHYLASLLINSGADVKVVQHRVRHTSAATTLDVYGHMWPDSDESTRTAVQRVFAYRLTESSRNEHHP